MTALTGFLKKLRVGQMREYENMAIFPLLVDKYIKPAYLLPGEALEQGMLEIKEVCFEGSINEVLVHNKSERPVLFLDGDILLGAKQNRVINASILVGPRAKLKVLVSCVEECRWRYNTACFTISRRFSYSKMRALKNAHVTECLMFSGAFNADQFAIWDEVERKQREMRVESSTYAVNDIYKSYEETLGKYCGVFQHGVSQVGVAVFINGKFACLDALDNPASLQKLYQKLVESYALDALEVTGREKKKVGKGALQELLDRLLAAKVSSYPSAGLGEDLRFRDINLAGSCLVLGNKVVHLAVFAGKDKGTGFLPHQFLPT